MPPSYSNNAEAWGGIAVCEWDLPWLDGFELVENDDFIVAYHSAGSRSVRAACNGPWSDRFSTPGLISVIPPGRRVVYRIDGEVCFSSIHIPRRAVGPVSGSSALTEAGFHFAFQDAFAQSCMETLLDEAHSNRSQDISYITAVTRALLLHLLRAFHSDTERSDTGAGKVSGIPLEPILSFIDSRLAAPLTLNCLADQAGVSRAHFARFFRDATGVSPHRYITLRRVEKAKDLLKLSRLTLAQISQDVGFSNQSHFSQVFNAVTGMTPSRFRQSED